jgi:uncharacterized coiled-coil protein SlyX
MTKNRLDISDQTAISMPMKNLISIVIAVAIGVWAYFGVLERITMLETKSTLAEKDLTQVTSTLGSPPADSEQFMLIEHIAGQLEAVQERMENMMNNGVNIKRLQEDVKILRDDVEKLKDSNRNMIYSNGNGTTKE